MSKLALIWSAVTAGGAAATTGVLVVTGVIDVESLYGKQSMAPAPLVSNQGDTKPTTKPAGDKVAVAPVETKVPVAETPAMTPATDKPKPSFDIVRVEPTGDAVVAGQSEPGAIVALLSNGKVVGKTVADGGGDWTIVLEEPLEPGDHDISATTMGPTGSPDIESEEHVAVSVPKDKSEDLIVVMSKPGEPTKVLQKPVATAQAPAETAEPAKPTVVAAAKPEVPAEAPQAETPAVTDTPAGTETPVVAETPTVAETPAIAETPENETTPAPETPSTVVVVEPASQQPDAPMVAGKPKAEQTPAPEIKIAKAEEPAAPKIDYKVSLEAVETENGKLYVAGAGTPGTVVRVYIDDKIAGTAKVDDNGRWLMEAPKGLDAGKYQVRADQVADGDSTVVARAAVTFEREPEAIVLTPLTVAAGSGGEGGSGNLTIREVPSVIIRKGDNLWRISRRRYGHGIRYTTIYGANQAQIRNPDLIYPGQVFMVPEGDVRWETN